MRQHKFQRWRWIACAYGSCWTKTRGGCGTNSPQEARALSQRLYRNELEGGEQVNHTHLLSEQSCNRSNGRNRNTPMTGDSVGEGASDDDDLSSPSVWGSMNLKGRLTGKPKQPRKCERKSQHRRRPNDGTKSFVRAPEIASEESV